MGKKKIVETIARIMIIIILATITILLVPIIKELIMFWKIVVIIELILAFIFTIFRVIDYIADIKRMDSYYEQLYKKKSLVYFFFKGIKSQCLWTMVGFSFIILVGISLMVGLSLPGRREL